MSGTTLTPMPKPVEHEQALEPVVKRQRVLLVEGDGFTRLVLLLRLRLAGLAVDFTSNGILGLSRLKTCKPDVLLVELRLNGLSGLELIQAARAEPSFGDRPIYVFTHADRIGRATRKALRPLNLNLLDKNAVTREEVVQIFVNAFLDGKSADEPAATSGEAPAEALNDELAPAQALQELIAAVREQATVLAKCTEPAARAVESGKLLSEVRSVASCAEAARLANLARQARAVETLLIHLSKRQQGDIEPPLNAVADAVEVMSRIAGDTAADKKRLTRFSVVVFDEDPSSNAALKDALLLAGCNPASFTDAARVRDYLSSNRTDLIIINVLLPETHTLSLRDIRQLPVHARTPIIFGREPNVRAPRDQELPTRGARLDREPLMVAELVVRALNEVQRPPGTAPARAASASWAKSALRASAAQTASVDDGFALFTPAAPAQPAQAAPASVSPAVAAASHDLSFTGAAIVNHQVSAGSAAAMFRAERAPTESDRELEPITQMPVSPVDATQTDEQPLEAAPPGSFQAEQPPPMQPEPPPGDQVAAGYFPAAADIDPSIPENIFEFHHDQAAAAEESPSATSNPNEVMNDHMESVESMDGHDGLPMNQYQRQDLAAQIYETEAALHHAKGQIEQREKVIQALQQQLAGVRDNEGGLADQGTVLGVAQARCAELEQEVATLRQTLEEVNGGAEQAAAAAQVEAELRGQLDAVHAAALEHSAASEQAQARCAELEQDLAALQQEREDLAQKLAQEQTAGAAAAARLKELESRPAVAPKIVPGASASEVELQLRQAVASLARATAELAQERGQRQRSEQRATDLNTRMQTLHQDLSRTLQAQHEDLARITALEEQQRQMAETLEERAADLEQAQAERRLADEQVQKANNLHAQLHKDVAFLEEANKRAETSRQELQSRMEASLNATREAEARLQQEKAERQRLSDALDSLTSKAGDRSERDLELSKLESALQSEQVERQRQLTELAQVRNHAQDAASVARVLRTNLRRQVREPVDDLVQTARNLLELELGDEQKKLAQAVLEDVLLVQTRLREPLSAQAGADEAGSAGA